MDLVIPLQIMQIIIAFIVGFLTKSFLPAYFTKKGENLATKEDIGEITEQVEKIKLLYSAQMEDLRLSITEGQGYRHDQRACLLQFYDMAIELIYEKLTVDFGDLPMDQGRSLLNYRDSFNKLISNLIKSYQRIVVYFEHDADVRVRSENVLLQALEAQRVVKKYFNDLTTRFIQEAQAYESGENMNDVVNATNTTHAQYWNAMKPVVNNIQYSLQLYLSALNKFLRPNESQSIQLIRTED